ncbi:hypothetical protein Ahu01nite_026840 [Winogradskya humida]|uniref:Uncharacterized protein n=1 Tax=Winogradskya humida TaxID=113566 RepID=A0ABQ3ZMZ9_9ACTN|nr:hypothetical protein Ahu01nite_026840 [Actinoplanes humidus]
MATKTAPPATASAAISAMMPPISRPRRRLGAGGNGSGTAPGARESGGISYNSTGPGTSTKPETGAESEAETEGETGAETEGETGAEKGAGSEDSGPEEKMGAATKGARC